MPFPLALAEVTLGIGRGRRVILRSYQEEEAGEGAGHGLGWAQCGRGWDLWTQVSPILAPTDITVKAMMTEISIGEEDFQQLQAQEGVAITFCLKEFRVRFFPCPPCPALPAPPMPSLPHPGPHCSASPSQGLLSFAESANLSLSIHFDAPGR